MARRGAIGNGETRNRGIVLARPARSRYTVGPRILVVEDEPQLCKALADYLFLDGFDADTAHDGEAALDRARVATPDILLLDLDMPILDGKGVLAIWTTDPALSRIPVVLMSATPRLFEVARQFGIREKLAKPFDLDALAGSLERALKARDMSDWLQPLVPVDSTAGRIASHGAPAAD